METTHVKLFISFNPAILFRARRHERFETIPVRQGSLSSCFVLLRSSDTCSSRSGGGRWTLFSRGRLRPANGIISPAEEMQKQKTAHRQVEGEDGWTQGYYLLFHPAEVRLCCFSQSPRSANTYENNVPSHGGGR